MMASLYNTFHPFAHLPIELRLKVWRLTLLPRIVCITWKASYDCTNDINVRFDPKNCVPSCKIHGRPFREPIPSLLHVCRESRIEGLKIYTLFSASRFEGGYVNYDLDTLHHKRCHHETPAGDTIRGNPSGPFEIWDKDRSVLGTMAVVPDEVAEIKSLALCCCQISAVPSVSNFDNFVTVLQKYKSLKELLLVQPGTTEFVNTLKESEDELGPADDSTREDTGNGRMRYVRNTSPRGQMWVNMVQSWQFKERLEEWLQEKESDWEIPNIRCVVIAIGEVAWEQNFGQHVRERVDELR